nr:7TM GPCR domain containing protein [Haemonchus contortus]
MGSNSIVWPDLTEEYCIEFMMTSIVIERWIAFIFIRKYESGYTKLGPALIALAIFISSLLTFVLFNGQNFDGWIKYHLPSAYNHFASSDSKTPHTHVIVFKISKEGKSDSLKVVLLYCYSSIHGVLLLTKCLTFFNLYTLAMPVLSTLYFAKVKRQRMKDIKNHLDIKTIGSDGWTNYLTMIQKQWK